MTKFSYGMRHLWLPIGVCLLIVTLLFWSDLKLQKDRFIFIEIILSAEILTLILLAIVLYVAQTSWWRVKELEAINQELQKEIGDRKQVLDELSKSKHKYQSLVNWIDGIVWEADAQTNKFTFVSQKAERLLGYPVKSWFEEANFWKNHIHPDDREQVLNFCHQDIQSKKEYDLEYRTIAADGRVVWLRNIVTVITESDRPVKIQGVMVDITAQKQAETALRASEERYRRIIETANEGIWVLDSQNQTIFANKKMAEMLGYTLEEMLGMPLFAFTDEQNQACAAAKMERRRQCIQEQYDFKFCRKDGSDLWTIVSATPICDLAGQYMGALGMITDITSRKQAEADLRESEERWQLALRGNNDGIWDWNVKTNEVFFSTRWKSMLGYEDWEIANHLDEWAKRVHPDDVASATEAIKDHFAKQTPFYISEHRVLCKDGTYKWILDRGQALWDEEGNPIRMTGSHTDITERKRAEEELRWKAALLRSMTAASPLAFYVVDNRNDAIVYFNHRFCQIWGIEHLEEQMQRGELKSNDIIPHCLLVLLDVPTFTEFCKPLQSEENRAVVEDEIAFIDGRIIRRFSAQIRDESDRYFGRLYIFEDVTQRKQIEEALYQANQQLKASVDRLEQRNQEIVQLGELSDVLQACLTVEEAYSAIAKLVQPLFPNMVGGIFITSPSRKLVEMVASWGTSLVSQQMFAPNECWALRRGREHLVTDAHSGLLCKHLHTHLAESLCVPMMAQGEAIGMLHLSTQEGGQLTQGKQILARTVSEHIAMALANLNLRETLQNQSISDSLTGLFNRRYLEESLEREIHRAKRKQQSLGIIMLDVDHFKRFNDTFGHDAGDAVLRELGLLLQKHIRASDIACRYGGEELTVILPETSLEDTRKRAEQLRLAVKLLSVQHHGQLLGAITFSLGVAVFPDCGYTGEEIIQAADAALYRAKKQGRDRVVTAV